MYTGFCHMFRPCVGIGVDAFQLDPVEPPTLLSIAFRIDT